MRTNRTGQRNLSHQVCPAAVASITGRFTVSKHTEHPALIGPTDLFSLLPHWKRDYTACPHLGLPNVPGSSIPHKFGKSANVLGDLLVHLRCQLIKCESSSPSLPLDTKHHVHTLVTFQYSAPFWKSQEDGTQVGGRVTRTAAKGGGQELHGGKSMQS